MTKMGSGFHLRRITKPTAKMATDSHWMFSTETLP